MSDVEKLQRLPRQVARWQSAQQQLLNGQPARALATYRDLVQRFPGVPQLWVELGMAAMADLNFGLTEQAFRRAEQLAPRDISVLLVLAQQYQRLRRPQQARACFEQAAAAEPASMPARLSMAAWYERERRFQEAWNCLDACGATHSENAQVECVRALLLHRQGRNAEAEAVLRELVQKPFPDAQARVSSRHLLAVVLDQMGQYAEALRWLGEAKKELSRTANIEQMQQDYDRTDRWRRELLAGLTPEMLRRWRAQGPPLKEPFPLALLGGHPRSGTTLLEQILAAHPGLLAFDEPEAFAQEIWQALAPMNATQPLAAQALDTLAPARRAQLAQRYRKSLLREVQGELGNRLLLEKNPSPTAALHLWLRVFSNLKVIIALRDPRDVVLSCYFQNLALTPTNANFLSLERTAKHYSDLMDVWLRLRDLGGFHWVETRYEDLVANPESEGRRLTEFLGLEWHPDQAHHQEGSHQRYVFSPTYHEVGRPVHRRAVGRWQHYAAALQPLLTRLAPYCRALGYES
jgi:Flp pilus assembly protein TadD